VNVVKKKNDTHNKDGGTDEMEIKKKVAKGGLSDSDIS